MRLIFHDSHYCFINAHLAADTSMVDRRNQDFAEISKRMAFSTGKYKSPMEYALHFPWIPRLGEGKEVTNTVSPTGMKPGLTMFDVE